MFLIGNNLIIIFADNAGSIRWVVLHQTAVESYNTKQQVSTLSKHLLSWRLTSKLNYRRRSCQSFWEFWVNKRTHSNQRKAHVQKSIINYPMKDIHTTKGQLNLFFKLEWSFKVIGRKTKRGTSYCFILLKAFCSLYLLMTHICKLSCFPPFTSDVKLKASLW